LRHKKDHERSALVKLTKPQDLDLSAVVPSDDSYVLIGAQADYTAAADENRIGGKVIGGAPADSVLGRSFAAIPLILPMAGLPITTGLIGKFLIGDPLLTMILVILGLFIGVGFAVYLVRHRRPRSHATTPVAAPIVPLQAPLPAPVTQPQAQPPEPALTPSQGDSAPVIANTEPVVPEPDAEAGTPSP
jgi:hypothetical protein